MSAPPLKFFVGVDIGQAVDPTAIAVVSADRTDPRNPIYRCGHIERLPLHTTYPAIVSYVIRLQRQLPSRSDVVIDLTGVGRPTYDLFVDQGLVPTGVTITAGHDEVKTAPHFFSVPKLTLVSRVQSMLHAGRLLIQKDMSETLALVAELQDFRANVTDSGRWTFGARSGAHDDLVLALALACWAAAALPKQMVVSKAAVERSRIPGGAVKVFI
jgi:hypothetical protein